MPARRELDRRLRRPHRRARERGRRLPPAARARPIRSAAPSTRSPATAPKSMLVVPMRDHKDVVIGVVQLINKKRDPRGGAAAGLAGRRRGHPLHDGGPGARGARSPARPRWPSRTPTSSRGSGSCSTSSSTPRCAAVEQRDPTTSGHSGRVADADRGPRREGRRGLGRPLRGHPLHARPDARSCATPRCSTTSARSAVQEKYLRKEKKLYATQTDRHPAALRLHPEGTSRPTTCGRASRRSSPGAPARTSSRRSTRSTRRRRDEAAARARGGHAAPTSRPSWRRRASAR